MYPPHQMGYQGDCFYLYIHKHLHEMVIGKKMVINLVLSQSDKLGKVKKYS